MARGTKIWLNGKIVPEEQARMSLYSHGLHYGTGAFEGIRAYKQKNGGGAIFRLSEHIVRLMESVKIMGVQLPYSKEQLEQACLEICRANGFEECYLRPIVFIGEGPLGISIGANPPVEVAILTWEWGRYLGDKGVNEGIKLKTSTFNRPHVNSVMTKGKLTGQYLTATLAKQEAILQGFDEAVMLDTEGYLSEGVGESLFMVKDKKIITTPLGTILNGITRDTVLRIMEKLKLPVIHERFTRDQLWCADEVFLTGTAAEVTPVQELDGRKMGFGSTAGKPGPITLQIKQIYAQTVKGEISPLGETWLTKI